MQNLSSFFCSFLKPMHHSSYFCSVVPPAGLGCSLCLRIFLSQWQPRPVLSSVAPFSQCSLALSMWAPLLGCSRFSLIHLHLSFCGGRGFLFSLQFCQRKSLCLTARGSCFVLVLLASPAGFPNYHSTLILSLY